MKQINEAIKAFLANPQNVDQFYESQALIEIDWREYDENIVKYFNKAIGNMISVYREDNKKPYGDDIILIYKDKSMRIPYKEKMDRDITIKSINEVIKDDFSIRLFVDSAEDDTFAFCVLPNEQWEMLEKEFGKNNLNSYFIKVTPKIKMFDLQYDVVEYLRLKNVNPGASFFTIVSYLEIEKREKNLTEQRHKGEIELKVYLQQKKEISSEKEKFISEYGLKSPETKLV
ncbi:hypothetical protein C5Q96_02095 [Mogibacterium diversum]|uniref:Uncharacterized protein n=1 Tax=Mogibacterium diversum TaxID=114527 RepID=A0A2S0L367_9FIRM|nr:hypothetical protein [Mogibacterium diversum]AVM47709.1 hypothetical protein C5Q96_02095 [Mogibacterium diversum]